MSSLQNQQISQTFPGLIKTNDELAISPTLKTLQDGAGNNLPMEVSTTGVNFTGTVTGTPNTTYDYGAVGAAGNISMAMTGSDATNDVVVMQAGTNITLTDNGSNTFTIDAAGGGGGGPFQISYGKTTATGLQESDVVYATFTIPANTFTTGSEFEVHSMEKRDGLNATVYSAIWISDTLQTIGNVVAAGNNYNLTQVQSSVSEQSILHRNVYCTNATTETNWLANGNPSNDLAVSLTTQPMDTQAIDWTVNQYIYLQVWLDASVGTYTNYGVRVSQLS